MARLQGEMMGGSRVWVFVGENGRFASGVFSTRELAVAWIEQGQLTGLLTEYPVDVGAYDWAVATGKFVARREEQRQPRFVQSFTNPWLGHAHFENGAEVGGPTGPDSAAPK